MSLRYRDRMTTETAQSSIAAQLRAVLPHDRVIDDPATLEPYSYDASFWSLRAQHRPDVVVVPESTADVVATMRIAAATGAPIVPPGAGTRQTGGPVPARGRHGVSLARVRRRLRLDQPTLQ